MTTQEKKVGSVLDNLLAVKKPAIVDKEKTILMSLRTSTGLKTAFKKYCFLHDKDMTKILVNFIFDQLENFEKYEKIENKYTGATTPWNFRISEKIRDDFHRMCKEHGTDATTQLTQFILRTVENA
ncbi:MAG: hypothetical protein IJ295_02235 [Clostridia bacterium]|nr:hypothetical protein [Clostridia bacterium]